MSAATKVVTGAAARIRDGNPEPRLPCVVLLDVSGSMSGRKIEELNSGLVTFGKELLKDELAASRVEVAVCAFGGEVKIVQDFVSASQFKPPVLTAGGGTPMATGILLSYELYEGRKARYEASDLDSYGPWIFMVSDGEPTDSADLLDKAKRRIVQGESQPREKQIAFFPVGVEGANMQQLRRISVREPLMLQGYNFGRMFAWLGQSLRNMSRKEVGDDVALENPQSPKGWAKR